MHSTYRYITSLFLAAVLAAPAAMAAPRPQDSRDRDNNDHAGQVYDSSHKDYHNWNDNENQAWGRYESENHKKPAISPRQARSNRHNTGIGDTRIQMAIATSEIARDIYKP